MGATPLGARIATGARPDVRGAGTRRRHRPRPRRCLLRERAHRRGARVCRRRADRRRHTRARRLRHAPPPLHQPLRARPVHGRRAAMDRRDRRAELHRARTARPARARGRGRDRRRRRTAARRASRSHSLPAQSSQGASSWSRSRSGSRAWSQWPTSTATSSTPKPCDSCSAGSRSCSRTRWTTRPGGSASSPCSRRRSGRGCSRSGMTPPTPFPIAARTS